MLTLCQGKTRTGHHIGCGEVTEHEKMFSHRVKCLTCGVEHELANESVLARLREIGHEKSIHLGKLMQLDMEEKNLNLLLIQITPAQESPWKKSEFNLTCSKCGKETRWTYKNMARCYEGCAEVKIKVKRGRRSVTVEDLPDDLIALLLGGDDEPEVIKSDIGRS